MKYPGRTLSAMALPSLVAVVIAAIGTPAYAEDEPATESTGRILKGAAGAAIGGLLGNQVGGGQGRTAATAVGAVAGTVIASGCRVTGGTVLGGLLGGLLGSQVGGGNGKNVMAGVGASIGAFLGSDCSPVAMASLPEPMDLPAVQINGLRAVPMTGFPVAAFGGVPPITTPQDIAAAGKVVRALAGQAREAFGDGNTELALLSMYWAKRISGVAVGVADASQQTIAGAKGGRATVPAKALVILPAYNQYDDVAPSPSAFLDDLVEARRLLAGIDFAQGIAVADNSLDGVLNIMKALAGQGPASRPASTTPSPSAPQIPRALQGFPDNQVLRLPDGTMVMKSGEALTVYNPNGAAVQLPLDQLDFVPRTPDPSAARMAAADLMRTISGNERDWFFRFYAPGRGRAFCSFMTPNKVVDESRQSVASYMDAQGNVSSSPLSGAEAYKARPEFRLGMNLLQATDHAASVRKFEAGCLSETKGVFSEYQGAYANLSKRVCFSGNYANPQVFRAKTFYVGEGGQVVLTMESLLEDRSVMSTMNKALADGQALSDLVSFVPGVGNLESASQCLGKFTMAQHGAVRKALGSDAFARARLAGWQAPDSSEWGLDRLANCVGMIPLAGEAVAGAKVAAKAAGGAKVLASLGERADLVRTIAKAFESPRSFSEYVTAAKSAEDLFPGNPKAAGFIKTVYAGLMSGQNMTATASGAWHFAE